MWELLPSAEYERRHKQFAKKHPRELVAVLTNLAVYLGALRLGAKPQHRPYGFLHAEGMGVWAIDQKGGGPNLAQTRLYVFPAEWSETLYQITLGDKRTQKQDVVFSHDFVTNIIAEKKEAADEPTQGGGGGFGGEEPLF